MHLLITVSYRSGRYLRSWALFRSRNRIYLRCPRFRAAFSARPTNVPTFWACYPSALDSGFSGLDDERPERVLRLAPRRISRRRKTSVETEQTRRSAGFCGACFTSPLQRRRKITDHRSPSAFAPVRARPTNVPTFLGVIPPPPSRFHGLAFRGSRRSHPDLRPVGRTSGVEDAPPTSRTEAEEASGGP